jgi:serine/threonine protein kinase
MESGRVATAPGSGAEMMMMMNAAATIKATGTTAAAAAMGEVFSFQQLQQATDNFSLENLIANGHSGDLFKGVLHGTGTTVVVKRIDLQKIKVDSYLQELDVLACASHTRLVLLLGHCLDNSNEKFLVYKYAPNGDLESALQKKNMMVFPPPPDDDCHHVPAAVAHVHEQQQQCDDESSSLQSLDWITRLKIAIGVAEALTYLHFECSPPIAHRDVKASSILLDDKFEVRLGSLSDARVQDVDSQPSRITRLFGLSQASDHGEPGSAAASSTYDVYSFGKVLLELVSGKQGLSRGTDPAAEAWLEWALPLISIHDKDSLPKLVDPSLIVDEDLLDEVWAMAIIARACLHTKSSKRPSIQHVLKALENPGKVIRDDILGGGESAVRARTSSHSSWNEALFGSWRHSNNNNGGNLFNLGTSSTRAGSLREDPRTITNAIGGTATSTSSTTGDERLGGVGRHVRWGSSDIVPETVDDKTLDERTMPQGQV